MSNGTQIAKERSFFGGAGFVPACARIDRKGGEQARQYLQARGNLLSTGEVWTAIFTNTPPTAITNSILDMGATNGPLFYRIKAER